MARQKKGDEPSAGSPAWMSTFADLSTLLLCFFVLLYSMSNIDADKFNTASQAFKGDEDNQSLIETIGGKTLAEALGDGIMNLPTPEVGLEENPETFETMDAEIQAMYNDFKAYFADNQLSELIDVERTSSSLEVILKDNILFDKGKDAIRKEAYPILDSIAVMLMAKYPNSEVEIIGHTDNDPINVPRFPDNLFLSSARAINVVNYFINEKHFSPTEIYPIGRGEFEPIAPNDTEANKSKNRRVEIRIISSFVENKKK